MKLSKYEHSDITITRKLQFLNKASSAELKELLELQKNEVDLLPFHK